MAKAARKKTPAVAPMIEFSRTRDIPFNRIRLSDSNLREIDAGQRGVEIGVGDEDLRSRLQRGADPLGRALEFQRAGDGAAHGALAMTTPGDTSMADKGEVEKLMKGGGARVQR